MAKITFWAQSLDNVSPDLIEIDMDGQILEPNLLEREDIVNTISRISLSRRVEVSTKFVTIYVYDSDFILKTFPEKRDQAQRRSPIIAYGTLPEKITDPWVLDFTKSLYSFGDRIGRPLESKIQAEIDDDFIRIQNRRNYIKKKRPF